MDSGTGTMQSKMIGDGGMENTNIANAIKKKLQIRAPHSRISGGCSIHKVPQKFLKMREPSPYMPQVISIGPYHRTNQSLKSREDLKLLYAHKLLAKRAGEGDSEYARRVQEEEDTRAIKPDLSGMLVATSEAWLEECVSSIKKMETEVRECYSEPVDLNSREFVEMMIIDGLFIIGMLMRSDLRKSYVAVADDPFDRNDWLLFMVEQDLLLLENQVPLSVLQCLYNIIFNAERMDSLYEVIYKFITKMWQRMLPTHETIPFEAHPGQCEHAEHLLGCLVILIHGRLSRSLQQFYLLPLLEKLLIM
ncbi:uncharacterized protein LOC113331370 [Papaver somniferum]|uniref:uncharacterized protein LOC113331370 n=1 Tax=Papaver somniferum TaxID=3469 RepID=UPI000E6F5EA8|nr:uncharacterized protein LOC113331370 [Papaver somniferum]